MHITLSNQLPARLEPTARTIVGTLDPVASLRDDIVAPLLTSLPGSTIQITDDQGNALAQDDIMLLALRCLTGVVDVDAEEAMRDLMRQALIAYDPTDSLRFDDLYANQAGAALKWPAPTKTMLYTADTDIIPAAKTLLVSPTDQRARDGFLAALAYTYRPSTCGVWFTSEPSYRRFAEWLDSQVQMLAAVLDADTITKFDQIRALPMKGLTESLLLRVNETDDVDPTSFARLLTKFLDEYALAHPEDAGCLPFLASEHLMPMNLVLVNLDKTARATAAQLNKEWAMIATAINSPVKVLNRRTISRLDTFARAQQTAVAAANKLTNAGKQVRKAPPVKLRRTRPSNKQILIGIRAMLKKFRQVAISHNMAHSPGITFSKANRRDPMNYNLPGRTRRINYLPDMHAYLDTSGSITEDNYRDSVVMLIRIAQKLEVDLYLSSFSHELSGETLVRVRGRSASRIWNAIQRIPKVSGGTDFEQIWRHIQLSPVRRRRLSVIVTDFGWTAPTTFVKHPKNLVYAPCSNMSWDTIRHYAEGFAKSATHIDTRISRRFLGMSQT